VVAAAQPCAKVWAATLSNTRRRYKEKMMVKRLIASASGVVVLFVVGAVFSSAWDVRPFDQDVRTTTHLAAPSGTDVNCTRLGQTVQAGDIIANVQNVHYRGFSIQKLHKKVRADVPKEYGKAPLIEVSYVAISRSGRLIGKLDSGIFFGLGNSTEMGFFSFLDTGRKQLIISQDVPKGGCQWVVDFDRAMRVLFNGKEFQVGREAYDMTIIDLDGDQIYEIIVPICHFYGFQGGRLSNSETPLPSIVFRYDGEKQRYLPANVLVKHCLLKDIEAEESKVRSRKDQQASLGTIMSVTLDYVFVGDEIRGWKFFEETCKLPDKAKIKSDMQDVLNDHPVYRYIYNKRSNR